MSKEITCPTCGQANQVEKVSTVYLLGIGLKKIPLSPEYGAKVKDINPEFVQIPDARLRTLSRKLAPPSSGKQAPIRPIHPDMVAIAFSLISPIFLYGILTSQAGMLIPVVAILASFYGFYFWKRKMMISRFVDQQARQQSSEKRVRQGVQRWMKLYYCARDDGVFEPGRGELVPIEQMTAHLFRE